MCDKNNESSFSDLYAMYLFVLSEANKVFGDTKKEARQVVRAKQIELEGKMYNAIYGYNPYVEAPKEKSFEPVTTVINGDNPEEINLELFDKIKENDSSDNKFIVIKNNIARGEVD